MDFAVSAARTVAEAQVRAETAVPGDAVEPADPRDILAPEAWVLTASSGTAPRVRRVVSASPALPPSRFLLELDAPLLPGQVYSLALAPLARSAHGEPTSTEPVPFVGLAAQARQGTVPGEPAADIALPVSTQGGAPRGLAPLEALQSRLIREASTRRGAFAHAPSWGRGVEAKRTYSAQALASEAAALARELRADPDVRRAEVRTVKGQDHASRFEVYVEPAIGAPFVLPERITAGGP